MSKALTAIAAAIAITSLISDGAYAMGATSAPSKSNATFGKRAQFYQGNFPFTEFSSSSAKLPAPKH